LYFAFIVTAMFHKNNSRVDDVLIRQQMCKLNPRQLFQASSWNESWKDFKCIIIILQENLYLSIWRQKSTRQV